MEHYKIAKFEDNDFVLDVRADAKNETVWLTQGEMALLFNVDVGRVSRHISNIFKEGELPQKGNLRKTQFTGVDKPIGLYSLDVIISVGYRVRSQRGILFRKWSNKILKDYLIQGYAINQKRLENLGKTIDIQNRMLSYSLDVDREELSKVINEYTRALDLLDDYDHQTLAKPKGTQGSYTLTYGEALDIINSMKFKGTSNIFGVEKQKGVLRGIIDQIYQDVFGKELYPSVEEKAAHLLYFVVKDHPFVDGCKRIAATLFLNFLHKNNCLYRNNRQVLSNEALVAVTILTAESNPQEMKTVTNLIVNLLTAK